MLNNCVLFFPKIIENEHVPLTKQELKIIIPTIHQPIGTLKNFRQSESST